MEYRRLIFSLIQLTLCPLAYAEITTATSPAPVAVPAPTQNITPTPQPAQTPPVTPKTTTMLPLLPLPNQAKIADKTASINTASDQTITEEQALALLNQVSKTYEPILLKVIVNEQDLNKDIVAYQKEKEIYIDQEDLKSFGINLDTIKQPTIKYLDKNYYPASALPGTTYKIDVEQAKISFIFPPSFFQTSTLDYKPSSGTALTQSPFGGFLNYDSSFAGTGGKVGQSGAVLEAGMFTKNGIGTSDFLLQTNNNQTKFSRLNSIWSKDDLEKMRTYSFGDVFTEPGLWGRSTMIGGIKLSTNFAVRPDFVSTPIPSTHGVAALPSTIDLYINNALVSKEQVPPGPFSILNIPIVSGSGNVNVIVTDILGRQHVVDLPYYTSSDLLRKDLHKYSYELGMIRGDLSTRSFNYNQLIFSGTDNLGVTDHYTRQWHTEILSKLQSLGYGGNIALKNFTSARFALAASHSSKLGFLALAGLQYQCKGGRANFGFNTQTTTAGFTAVGMQTDQAFPSWQNQFTAGFPLSNGGLSFSYTTQNNRGQPNAKLFSASYSRTIFTDWALSFSALFTLSNPKSKAFMLNITKTLGRETSFSLNGNKSENLTTESFQINRSMPMDGGFGYNIYGQMAKQQKDYRVTLNTQNSFQTYALDLERQEKQFNYRGQISGGVAFIGKHAYLTKRISDSFGLVQVPGYKDIKIYHFNQEVARTDKYGNAFITKLLPYQDNPIKIETEKLPLDVKIGAPEQTVKPAYRSGVIIQFDVKITKNALLRLATPDGKDIPPDTIATNTETKDTFYVATEGAIFVTDLAVGKINHFEAPLEDETCLFDIDLTDAVKAKDPFLDLGTVVCKMTATPAEKLTLADNGEQNKASLVISDDITKKMSLVPSTKTSDLFLQKNIFEFIQVPAASLHETLLNPKPDSQVDFTQSKTIPQSEIKISKKETGNKLNEIQNKIKTKIKNLAKKLNRKLTGLEKIFHKTETTQENNSAHPMSIDYGQFLDSLADTDLNDVACIKDKNNSIKQKHYVPSAKLKKWMKEHSNI